MVLHMHRKIIAILAGLMLLVGTMPAFAWAEEASEAVTEPTKVTAEETDINPEPSSAQNQESEAEAENAAVCDIQNDATDRNKEENSISITVSIVDCVTDENAKHIWIDNAKIDIDKGSSIEDLLDEMTKQWGTKYTLTDEQSVKSISGPKESNFSNDKLETNKEDNQYWVIYINDGKGIKDVPVEKLELKKSGQIIFSFEKSAEPQEDEINALERGMLRTAAASEEIAFAYGNTKDHVASLGDADHWAYGQEWVVIGNARAGVMTEEQMQQYLRNILTYVQDNGSAYLDPNQSSDNSRLILALTAMGEDPTDVAGYDLLEPLANFNYLKAQGMNGPLWALLAFDSGNYEIPETTTGVQVTRENLVSFLLGEQHSDGGWAYSGSSDIDMTAMVLQGLAPYYANNNDVKQAVDKALTWLSNHQNSNGAFATGIVSSESQSQVIVALTSLGIDPDKDSRFVKNGNSALDALLSFYVDGGGFKHVDSNWKANQLASVQGNYALVAYYRFLNGANSLYQMGDNDSGYVIDVDYMNDDNEPTEPGDEEEMQKPKGRTMGITKAAGLIKLSGADAKSVNDCIEAIKSVLARNLSDDATTYSTEDIKAIADAYRLYADLNEAGKLAIRKDEHWGPFEKITTAVGKVYHYDEPTGVDLRDNEEETLPWYVKLAVNEGSFTKKQADSILDIMGEGSIIFYSYDITLENTLEEDNKWEPEKIVNAGFPIPDDIDRSQEPTIIHIGKSGKIEFVSGEVNEEGSTMTIKATSFSVYGLAGTQKDISRMLTPIAGSDTPQTGYLWGPALVAALALMILIVLILQRRKLRGKEDV